MTELTEKNSWSALQAQQKKMECASLQNLFGNESDRFSNYSLSAAGLFLDYSKNHVDSETMRLLIELANECRVADAIDDLFSGEIVNHSERRAALHTALRDASATPINVDGVNIKIEIKETLLRMQQFSDSVRDGTLRAVDGQSITDVIHVGMGGSHLGPALVYQALQSYVDGPRCHFINNADASHLNRTLTSLNPDTTLVVLVSKSFTTSETLTNATLIQAWLNKSDRDIQKHFVAVTAEQQRAVEFGINPDNIFPLWDWVSGRFSVWSPVGLSIAIAAGFENFKKLLAGAYAMDQHFRTVEFNANMPVLLALLGIWSINFFNAPSRAIIPYGERLRLLTPYLQQAHMESLGKRVSQTGEEINWNTGAILWGDAGTSSQHSFHQMLMQGKQSVPVDFVLPLRYPENEKQLNEPLVANCLAQSRALMEGYTTEDTHRRIPGNCPSNTIVVDSLTPERLGTLLALYEHKIFVQSVIWGVNAFDQWGVERGKQIAKDIMVDLQLGRSSGSYDASTHGLLQKILGLI